MNLFDPRLEGLSQALLDDLEDLSLRLQGLRSRGPEPRAMARISFWLVACRDAGHRLRQARAGDLLAAIVDVKVMLVQANEDCRAIAAAQPVREHVATADHDLLVTVDRSPTEPASPSREGGRTHGRGHRLLR